MEASNPSASRAYRIRRSDSLREGNYLVGMDQFGRGAKKEEVGMSRSLSAGAVHRNLTHPGGHGESQAKYEGGDNNRRVVDRRRMIRCLGKNALSRP